MKKFVIVITIAFFGWKTNAQETAPNYLMYRYNMNILNPAYAGVSDNTEVGIGFRKQQMDFNDDSSTQYVSVSKGFGKNLGLGLSLVNDKVFISKKTDVMLDVSYKLQLDRTTNLYFGAKLGGAFSSIDFNSLGVNDPLLSGSESAFSPSFGIGAYLKGDRYFLNITSPNLILSEVQKPKVDQNGNVVSDEVTEKFHMYFGGGYRFTISENIDLTPSVFARIVTDETMLMDVSAVANFSNKIEAGLTYRLDTSIIGSVMLKVIRNTSFGYAYESLTSDFSAVSSGTHEFVVRFHW
ncbi:PorP/SprF family type IX secretion system membrane protein [Flavicella marina]|uniref:PorP/SprF family type IX secretion system membrane protein n=1 Tax=Flavicella marina TaxID=1475951 RepID=UPI00186B259B|nr:PorP/SprF family type IX secretion system membrane protein [Flavicella marina]